MASHGEEAAPGDFQENTAIDSKKHSRTAKGQFPEPVVISPQMDHRLTFIILHGRGSTAQRFCPPLLETAAVSGEKLQTAFPHAKIVFPTASLNRATIYKRAYTHQWFDGWHIEDRTQRQDLTRAGLHKSCTYVHSILQREIALIGKENVVLWGLSQGCATSLTTLLTWDGGPFAAVVGMCGYLPFANHIGDIAKGNSQAGDKGDEPFSHSGDDEDDEDDDDDMFEKESAVMQDRPTQAVTFLRDEIDMDDKTGVVYQSIPVFLGHGTKDEKVAVEIGREAKTCLGLLRVNVQMVEYEGLGHWYSDKMLGDIFDFLREKLCIEGG